MKLVWVAPKSELVPFANIICSFCGVERKDEPRLKFIAGKKGVICPKCAAEAKRLMEAVDK